MKKVGIMSMQRIKNYGSFLQAFALKSIIESLGCDVQFVDYHVERPILDDASKKKGVINKGLEALEGNASLKHKLQYIVHKRGFKKYFKLLNLSKKNNYNPQLDTLVIGSDEVFNIIQANKNVGYSLELFGKDNNSKKVITYAASFGNTTFDKIRKNGKQEEISNLLKEMNSISVRDENSYNIVKELTNIDPVINLDPVLIFDYNNSKLIPNINIKEKYMILYAYNGRISTEEAKCIKQIANERGLKVYSIGGSQLYADKFVDCSPFEVLAYFKHAEFIITDTFHGSIFSIINQKKFVTLVRKSKGLSYGNEEKIAYLLDNLGLADRMTYDVHSIEKILNKNFKYSITNEIIKNERIKSINYLKNKI